MDPHASSSIKMNKPAFKVGRFIAEGGWSKVYAVKLIDSAEHPGILAWKRTIQPGNLKVCFVTQLSAMPTMYRSESQLSIGSWKYTAI
jgi:hypothetical protein